jgi:nicotinate-nucleotide--dimethylbenzimidazole phosphoribosyltransferase
VTSLELARLIEDARGPDVAARRVVEARATDVLRPAGAFARLDSAATWLAGWQRTGTPRVTRPGVMIFAADHGVTSDGVSLYPAEVTAAMVAAIIGGVATVAVLARSLGATLTLYDVGVGKPTDNLRSGPAMSTDRFEMAFKAGRDAVRESESDVIILGELGIGNTTAAACVAAALLGGDPESWIGPGTGVVGDALDNKHRVVFEAVGRISGATDPLEILREVGGLELAAMAGAAFEARLASLPVLLDGFVVSAALLPLSFLHDSALDHVLAGHRSPEPGHHRILEHLHLDPLVDLSLRLGEGSGALIALPILKMACEAVNDVATFEEFGLT